MIKKILFLLSIIITSITYSQNQWAWMAGDNVSNSVGTAGTLGVYNAANTPPASTIPGPSWTDKQNNFWMLSTCGAGVYMWQFDPTTAQWRTVWKYNGAGSYYCVFNLKTWSATDGPRSNDYNWSLTHFTWTDTSGVFWMYGYSSSMATYLTWKFDPRPSSPNYNQWMCLRSEATFGAGQYGIQGVPSATNYPPLHDETVTCWADSKNNLWLFGGGSTGSNYGDLWKYDIANNEWTWMSGSSAVNPPSVYGTKGVPAPTNQPGGRWTYDHWIDNNDNLWVTGANVADMWRYDTGTNEWTWEAGPNVGGSAVYSSTCVENATNTPAGGETFESRWSWTDNCGNFWFYGSNSGNIWKFRPSVKMWTLVSSMPTRNIGAKGVFNATYCPGGTSYNGGFRSKEGFWLFEGANTASGTYSNMWLFAPYKPTVAFTPQASACSNGNITFANTSVTTCGDLKEVKWDFGDPGSGAFNTSASVNSSHQYSSAGSYQVKLVVTNCTGQKDSLTQTVNVAISTAWTINSVIDSSKCSSSTGKVTVNLSGATANYSYSWSDGTTGSTTSAAYVRNNLSAGTYSVTITDGSACTAVIPVTVPHYASPVVNLSSSIQPVTCGTQPIIGTITTSPTGATPFTYSWNTGASTSGLTNVGSGSYVVTVTDVNGCTSQAATALSNPISPMHVVFSFNTNATSCNPGNGQISLSATGPNAGIRFTSTNGAVNSSSSSGSGLFKNLVAGTYLITITDTLGCSIQQPVTLTGPLVNSALAVSGSILCNGGTASATATATNGTASYSYSWSNGVTANSSSATDVENITAGNYTVTITDANNCSSTSTAQLTQPAVIVPIASQQSPATCGANNGSALASATGGTGALTYSWSNGASGKTASGLSAGTYTLTVYDASGCTKTQSASISNSPAPTINSLTPTNILCKGNTTGSAVVNASGSGTLSYSWSLGGTGLTESNLGAGTYTITVTDGGGCQAVSTVTISEPATGVAVNSIVPVNTTCGNSNGQAIANASGGTGTLTYSWSNLVSGQTVSSLAAATYTVTVKDGNACSVSSTVTINSAGGPAISAVTASNPLCSNTNGSAVASASGGTGALTYSWSNTSTGSTVSGLSAGTYTVTVKDANGCASTSTTAIVAPSAVSLSASQNTAASCGNNNGVAITTAASGGTGSFTYLWSNGSTGLTASSLTSGTYTVTATDGNGCTATSAAIINNSPAPVINSMTPTQLLCSGATNASAVVSATGTGTLTYTWTNGNSGVTSGNLNAGTYYVTVTDGSGCNVISSVVITAPPAVVISATTIANASCGASDGSAVASASGGTGGLTYSWSNTISGSTASGLSAGIYTFTVTDANGCSMNSTAAIGNTNGPSVQSSTPVDELCNGGNTGSASVNISGGSAPYTYSWSNGTNAVTTSLNYSITALPTNTYVVTITDNNNCSVTASVIITEPVVIAAPTTSTTNSTCGNANGSATAVSSGGTGALTYSWSASGGSGSTVSGLAAGTYTVSVVDANNCSVSKAVTIGNNNGPALALSTTNPIACNGGTGGITATVTGGNPNYTYSWSTGVTNFITSSVNHLITSLTTNTYTVTIIDANGCSTTSAILLTEPSAVAITNITPVNSNCGSNTGSATATASGGTGTLTYTWSNTSSGAAATGLAAGIYTVTVTDANACTVSSAVNINNNGGPVITSAIKTDLLCNGASTGSATVAISGGASPYTYVWSAGATETTTNTQSVINNLSSATYSVTITDANGCQVVSTVTITQPTAITITGTTPVNATCGTSNGSALATATGGTGSLTYSWSNSVIGQTNTGLAANTYILTVTDAAGCTTTQSVPISNSPAPTIGSIVPKNALCNGSSTGSAVVNASGGAGTLTYNWSSGSTSITANNLSAAIYTVTVTDANGCQQLGVVTIAQPTSITVTGINSTSTSCNANTGSAVAMASGGVPTLTYNWSNTVTGATDSGLGAGNYTLTVTDGNGCTITNVVTINSTNGPTAAAAVGTSIKCNGQTGSVTTTASNGTSPYTYSWSNGTSSITSSLNNTITSVPALVYTVTITDNNGCTSTSSVTLSEPAAVALTEAQTDATCGNSDGTVSVTISGGISNYTYSWSNGSSSVTSSLNSSITSLQSGTYVVTVTDANGCSQTTSATITNSNSPVAGIASSQTTITEGNSTLLIGSSTGTGVTYTWTPGTSLNCSNCVTPTANPGSTTTYTLYVKDNVGCVDSAMITITVKKACSTDEDVYIANIFSPNGDGINDVLNIQGTGLTSIYWAIYDRWGNLVFQTTDPAQGWDGTENGRAMESATYVYYLKAICKKTNEEIKLKGNVSILK